MIEEKTNFPVYENKTTEDIYFETKDVIMFLMDYESDYITDIEPCLMEDVVLLATLKQKSFEVDDLNFIEVSDLMEALISVVEVLKPRSEYRIQLVDKSITIARQIQEELRIRGL